MKILHIKILKVEHIKCIDLKAHIQKKKWLKSNDLSICLEKLQKEQQKEVERRNIKEKEH